MFYTLGTPERLSSIGEESIDIADAKSKVEIAILDDKPFAPKESLAVNKFRIVELGPDIRALDQISAYSIIVSDVGGVGKAFGSSLEGAHLVAEIRKAYPDKFLVAYTGLTYSLPMMNALSVADKRIEKDAKVEVWIQTLELGINEVINPRNRWIRMRRALLERGLELIEVLKLEQAYIKSVRKKTPDYLSDKAKSLGISQEAKDLVIKFSATAIASLITQTLGK